MTTCYLILARANLTEPSGPTGRAVAAQGHPRAIFKRAIEHGNVTIAEMTVRELNDPGDRSAMTAKQASSRRFRNAGLVQRASDSLRVVPRRTHRRRQGTAPCQRDMVLSQSEARL
jgi:hypothetical protein